MPETPTTARHDGEQPRREALVEHVASAVRKEGWSSGVAQKAARAAVDALREQPAGLREALERIKALPGGEKVQASDGDFSYVLNGYEKAVAIATEALAASPPEGENG